MRLTASEPRVRATFLLLCLLGVLAGIVLPMSVRLAGMQDSDGALTALISTQKLTWYFWGQDRLLNLLPALAWPFRDPQTNLHVQVFLRAVLAFLSPLAVICLFRGSWKVALLTVALTQYVLACALSPYGDFNMWVQHNPSGTSLVMFAVSSWLCRDKTSWRMIASFFIALLAYAVNLALVTWSLPFILVAWFFGVRDRRWLSWFALINLLAFIVAFAHAHYFGEGVTSFRLAPSLDAVVAGYSSLAKNVDLRILGACFVVAFASACFRRTRETWMAILVAAGMAMAVGSLACLDWLQQNDYNIRYFLTFVVSFVTCCAYVVVDSAPELFRSLKVQAAMAMALLMIMFFGPLKGMVDHPGALIALPWRDAAKAEAQLAVEAHAELIVGDFWDVWPAVMDARSELYRTGRLAQQPLYGLTFRAHVLRRKINKLFNSQPAGVIAVCLQATVEDCAKTANFFGQLAPPIAPVKDSVLARQIAGRTVYVVTFRLAE